MLTHTNAKGNDCFSTNNIKLNAFIARHKFLLANIYCTVTFNLPEMFYYTRKKEVDHVIHSGLKFLSCVLCLPYICKKIYNSCKIFLSEKSCEVYYNLYTDLYFFVNNGCIVFLYSLFLMQTFLQMQYKNG